jgi:hypothetical protein
MLRADAARFVVGALAACALTASALAAGPPGVVDTFTATTANMTPAGLDLRIQILEWQDADTRAEVVAAMAAGPDAATPLAKLPTVGYVWPSESPVGYSVKYAYREQTGGGERITLVTDKRLGSYDFKGWSVASPAAQDVPYSVIELYLPGSGAGTGTLSIAAEVMLDEQAASVRLKDGAQGAPLLASVNRVNRGATSQ